jgi:hypothetical protein
LQVQLMGACFARDAVGILEEQLQLARRLFGGVSGSGAGRSVGVGEQVEVAEGVLQELRKQEEEAAVVLVSKPEPAWMTPDWRKRLLAARYAGHNWEAGRVDYTGSSWPGGTCNAAC